MALIEKPKRTNKVTGQPRKQVVQYADTPDDLPHPAEQIGNLWMAKSASGPWYNRKKAGFYRSHGVGWRYEGSKIEGKVIVK